MDVNLIDTDSVVAVAKNVAAVLCAVQVVVRMIPTPKTAEIDSWIGKALNFLLSNTKEISKKEFSETKVGKVLTGVGKVVTLFGVFKKRK